MSVEQFVISALVEEGSPKKAFQEGITADDFDIHDDEFKWLVNRYEHRKPINKRLLKQKFPEFEYLPVKENTLDLLRELKQERSYIAVSSAIDEVLGGETPLDQDNAIHKASQLREILGDVLRLHSPQSDVLIKGDYLGHLEHIKNLQLLRDNGELPGWTTGLKNIDHHCGGLQKATVYLVLGRPGDAKSFLNGKFSVEAMVQGARVGFFSPEMTEHQHRCRINTLLSARPEIQEACGLKGAFRNRALKDGFGFNIKKYKKFLEYVDEEIKGEILLFTQKYRREKMTPSYIETRVEDAGLDFICIDPIYKLKSPRQRQNKVEELTDITSALCDIAYAFDIPVVMSNQASRALVGNRGEPPGKDSSYNADAPVQEADVVMGVKHFSDERLMKVKCDKNRHGEPFRFSIQFWPNVGKMEDVTPIKGDYYNGYDPEKAEELREALHGDNN